MNVPIVVSNLFVALHFKVLLLLLFLNEHAFRVVWGVFQVPPITCSSDGISFPHRGNRARLEFTAQRLSGLKGAVWQCALFLTPPSP